MKYCSRTTTCNIPLDRRYHYVNGKYCGYHKMIYDLTRHGWKAKADGEIDMERRIALSIIATKEELLYYSKRLPKRDQDKVVECIKVKKSGGASCVHNKRKYRCQTCLKEGAETAMIKEWYQYWEKRQCEVSKEEEEEEDHSLQYYARKEGNFQIGTTTNKNT